MDVSMEIKSPHLLGREGNVNRSDDIFGPAPMSFIGATVT